LPGFAKVSNFNVIVVGDLDSNRKSPFYYWKNFSEGDKKRFARQYELANYKLIGGFNLGSLSYNDVNKFANMHARLI